MAALVLAPLLGYIGGALLPATATWGIAIGSAAGSLAGGLIGSAIDSALFAPKPQSVEGPALDSLKTMTADYGAGLGTGYGRASNGVVVIDSFDLEPVKSTRKVGGGGKKGGGASQRVTTTSYRCCYAVAFNHGTAHRLRQLRLGKKLAWDIATGKYDLIHDADGREIGMRLHGLPADSVTVWFGHPTQPPDPMLVRRRGTGNVPAYRGVAYISLDRLNPENYGGSGNPGVEVVYDTEPDAWDPRAFPATPLGHGTLTPTAPVPVSGRRWVTVGVQDGRLAARLWSVAPSRDGIQAEGVVLGPVLPSGTLSAVAAAASRDGRLVAVAARKPGEGDGALLAATFDADAQAWRGSRLLTGIPIGEEAGTGVFWLGDGVFGAPSRIPGDLGTTWHSFRTSGSSLRYVGSAAHGDAEPSTGILVTDCVAVVPDGGSGAVLLYNSPAQYVGMCAVPVSVRNAVTFGAVQSLFPNRYSQRMSVHPLDAGGTNWLLASSIDFTAGGFLSAFLATIRISGGLPVITRAPWSFLDTTYDSFRFCHLGEDRVGAIIDGDRVAGVRVTADGFDLAYPEQPLPGAGVPYGAASGGAQPGWLASVAADGSGVQAVRCWLPPGGIAIAEVLNRVCADARYRPGEYDWSGAAGTITGFYRPAGTNGRSVAENLSFVGGFETVLSGDRLVASPRTMDIAAEIPEHLAGTRERDGKEPTWKLAYTPGTKLPRSITVSHFDPARDFQTGSQESFRLVGDSTTDKVLNLPVALDADRARGIADERLYQAHGEDKVLTGAVPLDFCWLDPGENILYRGRRIRLTRWRPAQGFIEFEGKPLVPVSADYRTPTSSGEYVPQSWAPAAPSDLMLLDLPPLDGEGTDDRLGIRVAVSASRLPWPGATVYERTGSDYEAILGTSLPAVLGVADGALPPGPWCYPDESSSVIVRVPPDLAGRLASASREDWLAGSNLCLIGEEILRFRVAEQLDASAFRLSGLLRGRRGTEAAIASHGAGETFVLLDDAVRFADLESSKRGRPLALRAVTVGLDIGEAPEESITPTGRSMRPFAPVHLRGARNGEGDVAMSWFRRARLDAELRDWTDVPLDEPQELYDVEVLDGPGGAVLRSARTSVPSWAYTAAMQVQDLGSIQAEVHVRVYQISTRVGRGLPAAAKL